MRTVPWLVVVLSLLAGCRPEPPLRWESEHFVYRADVWDDAASAPMAEWMEHDFEVHQAVLGLSWREGATVDYRQVSDPEARRRFCGVAGACATSENAVAGVHYHAHELVHAYSLGTSFPSRFFVEGLAVLFGCTLAEPTEEVEPSPLVWELMTASPDDFYGDVGAERLRRYLMAASFLGSLAEHHGVDALMAFYRALDEVNTLEQISSRYADVFAESIEAGVERWIALGRQNRRRFCQWPSQCAYRPNEVSDGPATVSVTTAPLSPVEPLLDQPLSMVGVSSLRGVPVGPQRWEFDDTATLAGTVTLLPCPSGDPVGPFNSSGVVLYRDRDAADVALVVQGLQPGDVRVTVTPLAMPFASSACEQRREVIRGEWPRETALYLDPPRELDGDCSDGCEYWVTLEVALGTVARAATDAVELVESCDSNCTECGALGSDGLVGDGAARAVRVRLTGAEPGGLPPGVSATTVVFAPSP